jgi:hypothetical protein
MDSDNLFYYSIFHSIMSYFLCLFNVVKFFKETKTEIEIKMMKFTLVLLLAVFGAQAAIVSRDGDDGN